MPVTMKVDGLKELAAGLDEFKTATANNVMRRALVAAAQPIADEAKQLAPVRTGKLRDSIQVWAKFSNAIGKAAFAKAMRRGATKAEAVTALRDAQRDATGGSMVTVAVGPSNLRYASLVEYGAAAHVIKGRRRKDGRVFFVENGEVVSAQEVAHPGAPAQPYMRPAWEAKKAGVLEDLKRFLTVEIEKARQRAERKALKAKP